MGVSSKGQTIDNVDTGVEMAGLLKPIGLAAMLFCVNLAPAQVAEVLASWNLDGLGRDDTIPGKAEPSVTHPAVKVSALTCNGLVPTVWHDSLAVFAKNLAGDLQGAARMGHCYSFTVAPKQGKKISYTSIFNRVSINTGNLETGAKIEFVLTSSATGFASADGVMPAKPLASFTVVHPAKNDKATEGTGTFDVSGIKALQSVGDPVEFRIYAVLVGGVGNRMGYGHIFYKDGRDDLRVSGTVE